MDFDRLSPNGITHRRAERPFVLSLSKHALRRADANPRRRRAHWRHAGFRCAASGLRYRPSLAP